MVKLSKSKIILIILILFLGSYFIYNVVIKSQLQKRENKFIEEGKYQMVKEQTEGGVIFYLNESGDIDLILSRNLFDGGVFQTAFEQTSQNIHYYLDENNQLQFKSIEELCGENDKL